MTDTLLDYYRRRAAEYEKVYEKPERQADLQALRATVSAYFSKRRVLEVACGTGYWTRPVSAAATSIVAIDLAPETLAIARAQTDPDAPVEYRLGDAFDLAAISGTFDAGLVAFWWSHVTLATLGEFLSGLHRRLGNGARVLVMDNRYVEGSNYPITRTDSAGNTYQRRTLDNGAEYEVLKNFPSAVEVSHAVVDAGGTAPVVHELPYYWYVTYVVDGAAGAASSATRR
jgi:ubiquinone/menaquinone biosynthesis C-methylase UbiE